MGSRRFFPEVGKLGIWRRKSLSGVQGYSPTSVFSPYTSRQLTVADPSSDMPPTDTRIFGKVVYGLDFCSNRFIFVPNCIELVNLVKFP